MTSTYDSTGITLDRTSDVLARLIELAIAQWGESVDTDEDGFLGHMQWLIALLVGENNEVLQDVYDSISVGNATGAALAARLELIGLEREKAAYSTVTLTLTATKATTVQAGSQYKTEAGIIFATDEELVFTAAGSDDVESTCTIVGVNDAAATEVDTIVTSVYGISTVNNVLAAIPGRLQETDPEFKARHTIAVSNTGEESIGRIYAAVSEVTGVSSVLAIDNDTTATLTDGTTPYSIHIVVVGGSDEDVATAIATEKTEGVPTYGVYPYSVYNTTTRQSKTIYFDRATPVPIYIRVIATTDASAPDDWQAQITANLLEDFEDLDIGDNVIYTSLYRPIYDVAGVTVTDLYIDDAAAPTAEIDVPIDNTQRATLIAANVAYV